ncbi:MAG: tetratricopeptide repeat protein [Bacteroidales bacterium]|nr:tetratricopeptide repeat protein [Bacteroidales bacterium]
MKTTAQIIDYLDGELSGKELENFLQNVNKDTELKEILNLHKEVDSMLKDKTALSFFEKLDEGYYHYISYKQKNDNSPPFIKNISKMRFIHMIKYAAAILIVAGLGTVLLLVNKKHYSSNQLYSMYYKPYDADIINRSAKISSNKILEGITYYQKGFYDEAYSIFSSLFEQNNTCMEALFYKALSSIGMENYEEAIQSLQILIENGNSAYTTHADWYLGLCYLKLNQTEKAVTVFNTLKDSTSHFYSVKAKEMLKKIK